MAEPTVAAPVPEVDRLTVGFARLLRAAGLDVPVGATLVFAEGLAAVGVGSRDSVYWAGRATLVRRPEDVELYDRAFGAWWERVHEVPLVSPTEREVVLAFDHDGDDDDDRIDQWAAYRYPDGTVVYTAQSRTGVNGPSSLKPLATLPLTVQQLAAMAVDPKLHLS